MVTERPIEMDVVVVGSGGAGLTAAVTAAKAGLKVLVVEKADCFGGTTALSMGGLWVPDNPQMAGMGITDDIESARRYIQNGGGG